MTCIELHCRSWKCHRCAHLATRLPSPIVFCILRLGVDIWCAHHTGSITFCRSKLVFGVWGTCIFRSGNSLHEFVHHQIIRSIPYIWEVFKPPLLNMGIEKDMETWILWNRKDTHQVSYRTKLCTHAWFNTEEPAMNPSCVLSYGTVCICVLQWLSWMRSLNCHSLHLLAAVPLRGCRRFSRVRGTVDAVDVFLGSFSPSSSSRFLFQQFYRQIICLNYIHHTPCNFRPGLSAHYFLTVYIAFRFDLVQNVPINTSLALSQEWWQIGAKSEDLFKITPQLRCVATSNNSVCFAPMSRAGNSSAGGPSADLQSSYEFTFQNFTTQRQKSWGSNHSVEKHHIELYLLLVHPFTKS